MIKTREEWIASTREASLLPNPPLEQKDGKWIIARRKEAWEALGPRIFDDYLDRFRQIAIDVLRERDPQFELVADERFAARIYNKTLKHSDQLRKGVAETLALLGSFPQYLTSCSHGKAEATAAIAVSEILKEADWVIWASVNAHLPMLAEAAPNEFLQAVEKAAAQEPSPFVEIYAQESGGVMGRNYMTGLLWALETLAWHPDYLTAVIVLLGDLASVDPGGNWTNRPANSIVEILLPWHPQTCADVSKRKAAVNTLLHEHPALGWKLLLSLLPKTHAIASGTRKPTWRALIPAGCTEKVTNREHWEQVNIYAQLAIDVAESDRSKLTQLIDHLPNLSGAAHTRMLELLASDKTTGLPEQERRPLWEALVHLATNHRKFADADWAMSQEAVAKIEDVASKLIPKSPTLLYGRLFTDRDFDFFEEKGNYEEQRKALDKKRQEAVRKIITASGVDGIIEFARSAASVWKVGVALGVVGDPKVEAALLPTHLLSSDPKLQRLTASFVRGRFWAKGWDWVDTVELQRWEDEEKIAFLSLLPFTRETWVRAERLLAAKQPAYWNKTSAESYEPNAADLVFAAERLLEYGRTQAALQCLERATHEKQTTPTDLVIRALRENLGSKEPPNTMDQHALIELINWLQGNSETDPEKLFQIEWSYLPLLGRYSGGSPKTLARRLSEDPNFFCEVIRAVFRSKQEKKPEGEPSEERKTIAENAYRLLADWHRPPGCTKEGQFDEAAFKDWLTAVKHSTQESGHFEVAMSQLGQVLAYSPADPDGLWIHKAVADALNAKDAEAMRSGFRCELFNMRGTHGFTAGKEEREIAAKYREKAEAVENAGYHRLARSLRKVAESYEYDAEREAKRGPFG